VLANLTIQIALPSLFDFKFLLTEVDYIDFKSALLTIT